MVLLGPERLHRISPPEGRAGQASEPERRACILAQPSAGVVWSIGQNDTPNYRNVNVVNKVKVDPKSLQPELKNSRELEPHIPVLGHLHQWSGLRQGRRLSF